MSEPKYKKPQGHANYLLITTDCSYLLACGQFHSVYTFSNP